MNKRGQVSIFIILSILIVGFIIILFIIYNGDFSIKRTINPEIQPIYNYVSDCLKITGEDAVEYAGFTGGYYTIPNESIDEGIAYYYDKELNRMPSKEKIEKELSDYVNGLTFICIKEFLQFPDFNVTEGEISTSTEILDGKVVFNVDYPLSIKKGDNVYEIERFEDIKVPVRLLTIYNVAEMLIQDHMENEGATCLSCMNDWSEQYDLYFAMDDYSSDTVIFSITDRNSSIKDKDYTFSFANRY